MKEYLLSNSSVWWKASLWSSWDFGDIFTVWCLDFANIRQN